MSFPIPGLRLRRMPYAYVYAYAYAYAYTCVDVTRMPEICDSVNTIFLSSLVEASQKLTAARFTLAPLVVVRTNTENGLQNIQPYSFIYAEPARKPIGCQPSTDSAYQVPQGIQVPKEPRKPKRPRRLQTAPRWQRVGRQPQQTSLPSHQRGSKEKQRSRFSSSPTSHIGSRQDPVRGFVRGFASS